MNIINIEHISKLFGDKLIFDDASFGLQEGDKVGIVGINGTGKSTLLRQLKTALAPHGLREGEITFCGTPLSRIPSRRQAAEIGFVQQNPDNQIVTDFVWHELAFGLENMALSVPVIRRRVAEMAAFFGMETWFRSKTTELSGGQKQLMNLASALAMGPKLLILDEPFVGLDPKASHTLKGMMRELCDAGAAIFFSTHVLEVAEKLCNKIAIIKNGRLVAAGETGTVKGDHSLEDVFMELIDA